MIQASKDVKQQNLWERAVNIEQPWRSIFFLREE